MARQRESREGEGVVMGIEGRGIATREELGEGQREWGGRKGDEHRVATREEVEEGWLEPGQV